MDGSNDTGLEKMNPMTVRVYEPSTGRIVTRFLDMCTTTGNVLCCVYIKCDRPRQILRRK